MKRLLFLSAVMSISISCVNAEDIYNEGIRYDTTNYITLKYGLTSVSDDFSLKQHSFALDIIGNEISNNIKPKLDLTYVSIDDSDSVDYLLQGAINAYGQADYLRYEGILPYYYGGLGYEYVDGSRKEFDNSFYLQLGWGVEIPISDFSDDPRVVAEFRFMQMLGSGDGQDNEATLFVGLKMPLDGITSYDNTVSETLALALHNTELNRYDTVPNELSLQEEQSKRSRNRGDFIADEDGDGVADGIDVCSNTPSNQAVNDRGCPIRDDKLYLESTRKGSFDSLPRQSKILNVHFELNSDLIAVESREVVRKFVKSVNVTGYSSIVVEGYTDGSGRLDANKNLSQRRADSVKSLMLQYGIDSNKIQAIGKGSVNPIASDDTIEGRAQNRRIEITVK